MVDTPSGSKNSDCLERRRIWSGRSFDNWLGGSVQRLKRVRKLGTGDRERMRKEVEKQYPSHVFQPDTLPSMTLLQCYMRSALEKIGSGCQGAGS